MARQDPFEARFRRWYADWAKKTGIDPDPDHPLHKYDYRAAFRAGVIPKISKEDGQYHWPSRFKADDHPNRTVKGVDTKALDGSVERPATGPASRDKTRVPSMFPNAPMRTIGPANPASLEPAASRRAFDPNAVEQGTDFVRSTLKTLLDYAKENPVRAGFEATPVGGAASALFEAGRFGAEALSKKGDLVPALAMAALSKVGGPKTAKELRELAKKGGRISASAIKMPNGKILEGTSHFDAMERGGVSNSPMLEKAVSGYVDQSGAFLTLDEAGQRLKHLGLAGDAWPNARSEEVLVAQKGYAKKFEKPKTQRAVGDSVATALPSMEIPLSPATRSSRLPNRERAEQLLAKLKNDGGFTLDAKGQPVTEGYAVGAGKLPGANLLEKPLAELTVVDLENFLAKHPKDKLLGGWVDDKGVVFVEPSDRIPTKAAAIKLGRARGEQAVGDLAAYARGDFDAGTVKLPQTRYKAEKSPAGTQVKAFSEDGKQVGSLFLEPDGTPIMVNVAPEHRRQGIASGLYDEAERALGKPITPSGNLTEDAKAFWAARSGKKPEAVTQRGGMTEEPGGVMGVTFDTPNGPINVRFTHDVGRGTPLDVKTISTPEQGVINDKTPGANTRGVGAVRAVFEKLKELTGATEVTGKRVSGANKGKRVDRALADTLWHGTPITTRSKVGGAPFEAFDMDRSKRELGIHVGTKGQAAERLEALGGNSYQNLGPKAGQIFGVESTPKNPFTLFHDDGDWSFTTLRRQLQSIVNDDRAQLKIPEHMRITQDDLDGLQKIWMARGEGTPSPTHISDLLKRKGFDAIEYENRFEIPGRTEAVRRGAPFIESARGGTSRILFGPEDAKILPELTTQYPPKPEIVEKRREKFAELRKANPNWTIKEIGEQIMADESRFHGHPDIPEQRDIPRMIPKKKSQSLLDEVEERTLRAYMGPKFEKWAAEGNFGNWYDTFGTEQAARDALGDEEGPAAFKRLMEFMGATTARSTPSNNLRRAGYYRGLEQAGLLDVDALLGRGYKRVPTGMGHIANNAHTNAMATLLETGGIDALKNPKPASFTENLLRNQRPFTNDTRMATGLRHVDPKLEEMGAFTSSTNPFGGVTYSPRDWAYAPMERAGQRAARHYADRGILKVRPGFDPTAHFQAKVWDALGGEIPGASRSAGLFDDVFKSKLDENAKRWGLKPSEANALFWQGHPFDLPLNSDVVPRGLLSSFR